MPKQIRIQIPNPCDQNWEEMAPTQQGAFCKVCGKNVIDFSAKTENEIYEIITGSKENICGRFREDQLDMPITKSEIDSSAFNWKAIAASLAVLISAERSFGKGDDASKPPMISKPPFMLNSAASLPDTTKPLGGPTVLVERKSTDSLIVPPVQRDSVRYGKVSWGTVISGIVVDSVTHKPVEGVFVTDNFGHYQYTDSTGAFHLRCNSGKNVMTFDKTDTYDFKQVGLEDMLHQNNNQGAGNIKIYLAPQPEVKMFKGKVGMIFR